MKTCYKCHNSLPLSRFSKNSARKDGLATLCKSCWNSYYKEHYYLKGNEQSRLYKKNKAHKESVRKLLKEAREIPCMDCNVSYPYYVMDFDHRDSTDKSFNLSVGWQRGLSKVKKELDKCDVVCSNCHRLRTFKNLKT